MKSKFSVGSAFGQTFVLILTISTLSFATKPSKKHSTFYDYLTSSDFSCSLEKRVIKPGSVASDYNTPGTKGACLVTYSCQPARGIEAKSFTANAFCLASDDGVCEEPIDCAKRAAKAESPKYFGHKVMPVSSTSESANNKHNDVCWETNGIKDKRGTIQLIKDGEIVEEACVTAYVCKNKPAASGAACATKKEKVATSDGHFDSKDVCPQLNDCINQDVSIAGYSEEELRKLAETNPSKEKAVRAELAKPGTVASSKPPGNALSSTSFQPRNANIGSGSRASVSNPPAAKPASGHTGRGMK